MGLRGPKAAPEEERRRKRNQKLNARRDKKRGYTFAEIMECEERDRRIRYRLSMPYELRLWWMALNRCVEHLPKRKHRYPIPYAD
jgi:hypothetical protein